MPTDKEIEAEIETLKALMPRIRQITGFGDDNHEAIDAQILVLEKRLDDNQIWKIWNNEEGDEHTRSHAMNALAWLNGEADPPSTDWMGLAQ